MRRFLIGLVVVVLLILSIGIGITVARWPDLKPFGKSPSESVPTR